MVMDEDDDISRLCGKVGWSSNLAKFRANFHIPHPVIPAKAGNQLITNELVKNIVGNNYALSALSILFGKSRNEETIRSLLLIFEFINSLQKV
jgi:hypothetical protein